MESVAASIPSSSSSPFSSVFSPKRDKAFPHRRRSLLPIAVNSNEDEADLHADSQIESTDPVPPLSNRLSIRPLSKDAAMGLVLGAATGRGWTTPSGMEGPSAPAAAGPAVSTFPWSLFTKSPRRRMRVAFTCNLCGQRTTRAINPHAYTDGTVFVQCCGCNVFHKLVDNLNLFHDMKYYVNPSFRYKGYEPFDYLDSDGDDIFPLF